MSGIGLPKGMSRDDAYVQGMADGAAEVKKRVRKGLADKSVMLSGFQQDGEGPDDNDWLTLDDALAVLDAEDF